jgi:hypothetical protein
VEKHENKINKQRRERSRRRKEEESGDGRFEQRERQGEFNRKHKSMPLLKKARCAPEAECGDSRTAVHKATEKRKREPAYHKRFCYSAYPQQHHVLLGFLSPHREKRKRKRRQMKQRPQQYRELRALIYPQTPLTRT